MAGKMLRFFISRKIRNYESNNKWNRRHRDSLSGDNCNN